MVMFKRMVEMYKNYRPNVPDEFQSDELYAEPSVEVWAKVKTEDGNVQKDGGDV